MDGTRHPGITIYNDPPEITFRKNDSESRKDLVIKLGDDGKWWAVFYDDEQVSLTREI